MQSFIFMCTAQFELTFLDGHLLQELVPSRTGYVGNFDHILKPWIKTQSGHDPEMEDVCTDMYFIPFKMWYRYDTDLHLIGLQICIQICSQICMHIWPKIFTDLNFPVHTNLQICMTESRFPDACRMGFSFSLFTQVAINCWHFLFYIKGLRHPVEKYMKKFFTLGWHSFIFSRFSSL